MINDAALESIEHDPSTDIVEHPSYSPNDPKIKEQIMTLLDEEVLRYDTPEEQAMMREVGFIFEDQGTPKVVEENKFTDAYGRVVSKERWYTIRGQKWTLPDGRVVRGTGEPWESKFEHLQ